MKATEIGAFGGSWQLKLAESTSFSGARRVIAEFRKAQVDAARAAQENEERLARYAGVDAVDEQGRRLDRREFDGLSSTGSIVFTMTVHAAVRYRVSGRTHKANLSQVLSFYCGIPFSRVR